MKNHITLLLLCLMLSSCTLLKNLNLPIHKVHTKQGNKVTPKMINMIKIGLTDKQALFIMGSPLIKDRLNDHEKWIYIYENQKNIKKIIIYFKNNHIIKFENHE